MTNELKRIWNEVAVAIVLYDSGVWQEGLKRIMKNSS
jgi:hypothetical protein